MKASIWIILRGSILIAGDRLHFIFLHTKSILVANAKVVNCFW